MGRALHPVSEELIDVSINFANSEEGRTLHPGIPDVNRRALTTLRTYKGKYGKKKGVISLTEKFPALEANYLVHKQQYYHHFNTAVRNLEELANESDPPQLPSTPDDRSTARDAPTTAPAAIAMTPAPSDPDPTSTVAQINALTALVKATHDVSMTERKEDRKAREAERKAREEERKKDRKEAKEREAKTAEERQELRQGINAATSIATTAVQKADDAIKLGIENKIEVASLSKQVESIRKESRMKKFKKGGVRQLFDEETDDILPGEVTPLLDGKYCYVPFSILSSTVQLTVSFLLYSLP